MFMLFNVTYYVHICKALPFECMIHFHIQSINRWFGHYRASRILLGKISHTKYKLSIASLQIVSDTNCHKHCPTTHDMEK